MLTITLQGRIFQYCRMGRRSRTYCSLRSEHKFLSMVGQLALWKYGRGYALYENGELIAVFMYRKGALRVAELFAQAWPMRFGKELASKRDECQIDGKYKVTSAHAIWHCPRQQFEDPKSLVY